MKKIYYILLVIFLYLGCFFFLGYFTNLAILYNNNEYNYVNTDNVNIFLYIELGLSLVALIFGILGVISFRFNKFDNYKFIMIIKLVLTPFYILNYSIYFMMIFATLFSFGLQFFGLILLFIGSIFTYLSVFCTSFPIAFMSIKNIKEKKEAKRNVLVLIFSVLFCLDVVGSILAYNFNKKEIRDEECK